MRCLSLGVPALMVLALAACSGREAARAETSTGAAASAPPAGVAARGRLQPRDGLLKVAASSDLVAVVSQLHVVEGEHVRAGQVIAVIDTHAAREAAWERARAKITVQRAMADRLRAELAIAESAQRRQERLQADGIVPEASLEDANRRLEAARAALAQAEAEGTLAEAEVKAAEAELARTVVRAPVDGHVVKLLARAGETVGAGGLLELAQSAHMYAVAEVYETDATRIRPGLLASIRSPALERPLTGTVERIGMKVGKLDALGTDPAARTDARVVEVWIRLDEPSRAQGLTNLEVEVLIAP